MRRMSPWEVPAGLVRNGAAQSRGAHAAGFPVPLSPSVWWCWEMLQQKKINIVLVPCAPSLLLCTPGVKGKGATRPCVAPPRQHGTGGPRGEGCGVGAQPQLPGGVRNVGACGQQRAPRYQTQHQRLANVTPSREVASLLSPLAPSLLPAPTQPPSPASGPPQPPAPKVIWGQGQPMGRGGLLGPTPTV